MSLVRNKRREERSAGNNEGMVCVQQTDGSFKHISREEWEEANNDEPIEPVEPVE